MNILSDILKSSIPNYEIELPSTGKKITFRPFLVKEEKVLLVAQQSNDYNEILRAMKNTIESCFDKIENAGELPLFDIEYMFLNLRAKSIGEVVNPIFICPHTNENIDLEIDLLDVEVEKEKDHTNKINIKDDITITMKYPSVNIVTKEDKDEKAKGSEYFYDLAAKCIETIETKDETIDVTMLPKKEVEEFIDNLTNDQFSMILNFFSTTPRLKMKVDYRTSDGVEREVTFTNLTDFFG